LGQRRLTHALARGIETLKGTDAMTTLTTPCPAEQPTPADLHDLQGRFVSRILPAVERHARVYFRHLDCPHQRDDAVAETVAVAWKWFLRIARRGKDATRFPFALAGYAARAVHSGRRVCSQERAKDVFTRRAQRRHGFKVESLPTSTRAGHDQLAAPHGQQVLDAVEERLRDNSVTPVPEQVAFRLDWPAWLATRTERDRRIVDRLALGDGTGQVAQEFGMTPGRVSQLRREFHQDWQRFQQGRADAA
jgi:hypothetical protein